MLRHFVSFDEHADGNHSHELTAYQNLPILRCLQVLTLHTPVRSSAMLVVLFFECAMLLFFYGCATWRPGLVCGIEDPLLALILASFLVLWCLQHISLPFAFFQRKQNKLSFEKVIQFFAGCDPPVCISAE